MHIIIDYINSKRVFYMLLPIKIYIKHFMGDIFLELQKSHFFLVARPLAGSDL